MHRIAEMAHQAIDRIQQTIESVGGSARQSGGSGGSNMASESSSGGYGEQARKVSEQARKYGEQAREYGMQARQYGEQVRTRVHDQPLQAAGIAFVAGLLYEKMFMHRRRVKVVQVPVYVPRLSDSSHFDTGRARGWMQAAGEKIHQLGDSGHDAVRKLGATTMMGVAGTKAMSSRMWHKTRQAMPEDMSHARQQVLAKSHEYGGMARTQMQEHPLVGVGLAVGLGALAAAMAVNRRNDSAPQGSAYVVGSAGESYGRDYASVRQGGGYSDAMGSNPLVTAGLALGVGMLLGAVLRRH
ncbi:hypothetical protein WG922_20990 [Ramlibacter sp. AN1015]|uniref:hypothetical protein n=1 Tax=Ramlibacter sp. AN1015 TaxID=3133428 RepID=UPI0030C3326A